MGKAVTLGIATAGIVAIWGCTAGLGSSPDNLNGNDHASSSNDKPGSSTENPGGGESPTGTGGCSCPVGKWKCSGLGFTVNNNGKCDVDPCSGAFSINVEGQTISGTFKNGQLCLNGGQCYACVPDTGTTDGGTSDGGTNDSGPKDTGGPDAPKDTGTDVAKVCVNTCEIDTDCQNSCPVIPNAIACCDPNTFACTFQSGSVCQ